MHNSAANYLLFIKKIVTRTVLMITAEISRPEIQFFYNKHLTQESHLLNILDHSSKSEAGYLPCPSLAILALLVPRATAACLDSSVPNRLAFRHSI